MNARRHTQLATHLSYYGRSEEPEASPCHCVIGSKRERRRVPVRDDIVGDAYRP